MERHHLRTANRLLCRWLCVAGLAAVLVPGPALADGPTWVRSYPQPDADGCTSVVAQWSDGVYTAVPWDSRCSFSGNLGRAINAYVELRPDGCTWYVVRWEGGYTRVPTSCPNGATATRDDALSAALNP